MQRHVDSMHVRRSSEPRAPVHRDSQHPGFLEDDCQEHSAVNKLPVQLPESLHRSIKSLAEKEGYSVDQFLASAAAEKMAALRTLDYLRQEGADGRRENFERFLAAVPDVEPIETDRKPD
jgi:hypothetical protein